MLANSFTYGKDTSQPYIIDRVLGLKAGQLPVRSQKVRAGKCRKVWSDSTETPLQPRSTSRFNLWKALFSSDDCFHDFTILSSTTPDFLLGSVLIIKAIKFGNFARLTSSTRENELASVRLRIVKKLVPNWNIWAVTSDKACMGYLSRSLWFPRIVAWASLSPYTWTKVDHSPVEIRSLKDQ